MRIELNQVLDELREVLECISFDQQEILIEEILKANTIYLAGSGRSGLMIKAFAMRLMHLGLQAYAIGEVVTPAVQKGDLVIIASGSGATQSLVSMSEKAAKIGALVALITVYPDSPIGKIADCVVEIHAPSKAKNKSGIVSVQPMASLFEQSLMIFQDYTVIKMMERLNITQEEMFKRHANLE